MNTGKKNDKTNKYDKLAKIAKFGEVIFHTSDLANLWQIKNPNTLYKAIERYVKNGFLFRIYKGFYSIRPIEKLDPFLIGAKALHQFCYISTETVLIKEGIIQQDINQITLVSSLSLRFKIGDNNYYSRKLRKEFLYNPAGITEKDGIKIASGERAAADLLYFNSKAHFDAMKLIDWKKVREMQKEIGYPITAKRV